MTHLLRRYSLYLALLALAAAIFLGGAAFLSRERRLRLAERRERSLMESQLLAESSAGTLREVEARLQTAEHLLPRGSRPDAEAYRRLERQFRFVPSAEGGFLLDERGWLRYSWLPADIRPADAGLLLREHRNGLQAVRLGSLPGPGVRRLVLSRRLEWPGGEFRGVLGIVLDPRHFTDRYREYRSIDLDLIALYDQEARLLASWSGQARAGQGPEARRGEDLLAGIPARSLHSGGQQTLETPRALFSTFQLPDYPLWILVAYDRRRALEPLAPLAWTVHSGAAALSLTLAASAFWLRASARRRRRAELDLEASRAREELLQVFRRVALVASEEESLEGFLERALQEIRRFLGWPAAGLCLEVPGEEGGAVELLLWDGPSLQPTLQAASRLRLREPAWLQGPQGEGSPGGGPPDRELELGPPRGQSMAVVPLNPPHRGLFVYLAPGNAPQRGFLELLVQLSSLVQRIAAQRLASQEKRRLEGHLEQARRLEGLGTLAGGVAHDFNNMLAIILGNAELAAASKGMEEAREALSSVCRTALRAGELSQRLLAVAGRALTFKRRLDPAALVRESEARLREVVAPGARLSFSLEPAPGEVEADPQQLRQVLLSLVRNASEALPEGKGGIEVACGRLEADRAYLAACLGGDRLEAGGYCYLEVRDSGCGIDPGIVESLGEPFFSTKLLGRGLGLPASLGILRSHGGAMRITSRPGQGTTVTVLLPSCA